MAEPEVTVPAVGKVKKQHLYIGVAVVAGIVGYAWWRHSTAPPADIPAYGTGDVTTDGITDTAGGSAGGSANSGGASHDGATMPSTDQEWARAATDVLQGGYDVAAIQTAIGRYLTHQTLDSSQEAIVRAAVGALGYPPGGAYPISTGGGATPSALGQVAGLHVVKAAQTTIDLAWTAVTGAPGYRIYRSDLGSEPIGDSSGTSFQVRGLTPNKSYSFTVAARQGDGTTGPRSSAASGKTAAVKLTAPTGLKAVSATRTTVSMTCKPVAGATRYGWYVGVGSTYVAHGSSDGPAYTIQTLRPNTAYKIKVAADTTTQGPGPASAALSVKTKK